MESSITCHEPGIYLGMPFEEYLADPSLSNSGIQDLRVSPLTYWVNSVLNPNREPDDTEAKDTGSAFHKRILEGKEAFEAAYAPKLEREDYPNALKSGDELKAYCETLQLKKSGTLAELSARIREVDAVVELWTEIEAEHLKRHEGKEFLSKSLIERIQLAASFLESSPETAPLFTGGFPEVSVFWIDETTGVRMKARFDYLTLDTITDLKTFSNSQGKPLAEAVTSAIASYGYGTQAVIYLDAVQQAKRMLREQGFAAVHLGERYASAAFDFEGWFKQLAAARDHRFVFVFQESGRVPNIAIRQFSRNMNFYDISAFTYEFMLRRYRECMDRWGPSVPWAEPPTVEELADEDFPLWAFNKA